MMSRLVDRVEFFVLRYPDGKFVALDRASGGYPYRVELRRASQFTFDDAVKYINMFMKEGFTRHKTCLSVEVLDD